MDALQTWDWWLDGWIVAAGALCGLAAALLGNFLVLRRMSMLGDAISHAILPGLAAAFILSGSRSSVPMFLGAVLVGVLTALFTEWIRGIGKVDEGASMGVVFTSLFALGLVMIVQAADDVDLDPGCVLYGSIESTTLDMWSIGGAEIPRVVVVLIAVVLLNLLFVGLFFKELKISSFDPALATSTGFHARMMHYLLMTLVAVTAVASFESVGNILVVAMFVVPPATAYLLTDRLAWMIGLSGILAVVSAFLGHAGALVVPNWFGHRSTNTAGMMAVAAGLLFLVASLFAPKHGVLVKLVRRWILRWQILAEDVIALLYRIEEREGQTAPSVHFLCDILMSGPMATSFVMTYHRFRGNIRDLGIGFALTKRGKQKAHDIVRSHRLWEHYLVSEAGVPTERIHDEAEQLEHFTNQRLRHKLDEELAGPQVDPHGRPIPPETNR